jgi:AraC-like DNA-binding protein
MKPALRSFSFHPERSFLVRKDTGEPVYSMWHQHAEVELFLIQGGQGGMMIGDREMPIDGGCQMLVLGSNLPHTMSYGNRPGEKEVEAVVVHLSPAVFGAFYDLPEMASVRTLLKNAERGICVKGETLQYARQAMFALVDDEPAQSMLRLLQLLVTIASSHDCEFVASSGYNSIHSRDADSSRMNKIYTFVLENYHRDISVQEVADIIHFAKGSFCRYFKQLTGKTFMDFLIEVRIGNACKLLMEDEMNINEIAYACGYNNISNFFHQFKALKGCSPSRYQKNYFGYTRGDNAE